MTEKVKKELMAAHMDAVWFGNYELAQLIYRLLLSGTCRIYFSDADRRLELILRDLGVKINYDSRGISCCDVRN